MEVSSHRFSCIFVMAFFLRVCLSSVRLFVARIHRFCRACRHASSTDQPRQCDRLRLLPQQRSHCRIIHGLVNRFIAHSSNYRIMAARAWRRAPAVGSCRLLAADTNCHQLIVIASGTNKHIFPCVFYLSYISTFELLRISNRVC